MSRPTGSGGCAGHVKGGTRLCKANAVAGTDLCRSHAGKPLAVHKAEGRVVRLAEEWSGPPVQAGEVHGRMLSATFTEWTLARMRLDAARNRAAARERDKSGEDDDSAAMFGTAWGEGGPAGEFIRALAVLERQARLDTAALAKDELTLGLADRQVRVMEQYGTQMLDVVRGVLTVLGHDPDAESVVDIIEGQLLAVEAAQQSDS